MRKTDLKDMKKQNLTMVIHVVQENPGISRTGIAAKTHLSGSTVTALVGELLDRNILRENGNRSTGGRSQRCLEINPDAGTIAVFEISRRCIWSSFFDLSLKTKKEDRIEKNWHSGNDLLDLILESLKGERILGIGLLFQDDMKDSDFNVMVDAGSYAQQMKLKDALQMELRVPVREDYSVHYTITQALEKEQSAATCAQIRLGAEVAASITVDSATIRLRDTFVRSVLEESGTPVEEEIGLEKLIALICMMFPIAMIFISIDRKEQDLNARQIEKNLKKKLGKNVPHVVFLQHKPGSRNHIGMAETVRGLLQFT